MRKKGFSMALAVKNSPDTASSPFLDRLPIAIFAGVLYVVGSLAVVGKLLPSIWWEWLNRTPSFLNWTLLGTLLVVVTAVLVYVGAQLLGPHPAHGAKAGIFSGLVTVLAVILLARWASLWFEHWAYLGYFSSTAGAVLTSVVGLALLVGAALLFLRPKTQRWLKSFEDQGWFSTTVYKRSQGLLVRRATIFGILVIIGCGIFTLIEHKTLDTGAKHWQVNIPFTGMVTLTNEGDLAQTYQGKPILENPELVPPDKQYVLIKDKGDSDLEPGRIISRQKFLDVVKSLGKDKDSPTAKAVLDRFEMKEVRDRFSKEWVRIDNPGDLPAAKVSEAPVLPLSEFNKEKAEVAKIKGQDEPTAIAPALPEGTLDYSTLTLLPNVKFTVPILLLFLGLWVGWRAVNMPAFADFLIATEAELNKVSWTTAKRLRQDTIVVLTTVVLLTLTLLVFDWFWYKALKAVNVLQIPETKKQDSSSARPY
jgi:preprotein translocase SecE subunit